jgi:hypothetical protein
MLQEIDGVRKASSQLAGVLVIVEEKRQLLHRMALT